MADLSGDAPPEYFVHEYPVEVQGVDIWLDNVGGLFMFPELRFYAESPAARTTRPP